MKYEHMISLDDAIAMIADGIKAAGRNRPAASIIKSEWGGCLQTLWVPTRLVVSEANRRDNWIAKRARRQAQIEQFVAYRMAAEFDKPPVTPENVHFILLRKQKLDDDNLRSAFKGLRDAVARWLGVDDGQEKPQWKYQQWTTNPHNLVGYILLIGYLLPLNSQPEAAG